MAAPGSCARRTRRRWPSGWLRCSARAWCVRGVRANRSGRAGRSAKKRPRSRQARPRAGLNAAGMAAADIFTEGARAGPQPRRAGLDVRRSLGRRRSVATALAPQSRNLEARRALLARVCRRRRYRQAWAGSRVARDRCRCWPARSRAQGCRRPSRRRCPADRRIANAGGVGRARARLTARLVAGRSRVTRGGSGARALPAVAVERRLARGRRRAHLALCVRTRTNLAFLFKHRAPWPPRR